MTAAREKAEAEAGSTIGAIDAAADATGAGNTLTKDLDEGLQGLGVEGAAEAAKERIDGESLRAEEKLVDVLKAIDIDEQVEREGAVRGPRESRQRAVREP